MSPPVTLLGGSPRQRRWLLVPIGMMILLCLGSVYSWSIFRTPLENELGISATASILPYTFVLVFYAALMPIAGFYIPRIGTRVTTAIGSLVGLSAIGISSPVGEEIININPLFNGVSHPLFGWLSDQLKPYYVAIFSYVLILIACVLMVNTRTGQVITYLVAFCLFWFCLGGWLAMAPTITLRFFNPEQYAQIYGIVFTAYGVGALIGTLVTGRIRDLFGTYNYVFYPMAFLAVVGIVVACMLLKRERSTGDLF